MQFGRESNLGVDDAVAREVDGALGGDALELIPGLHDGRGVREACEVARPGRCRGRPRRTSRAVPRGPWSAGRRSRFSRASSRTVSGRSPPSRCSCKQNFGRPLDGVERQRRGRSWGQASQRVSRSSLTMVSAEVRSRVESACRQGRRRRRSRRGPTPGGPRRRRAVRRGVDRPRRASPSRTKTEYARGRAHAVLLAGPARPRDARRRRPPPARRRRCT